MGNKKDLTGQKFGRLMAVLERGNIKQKERVKWICKCECGKWVTISQNALQRGNTKSCGCLNYDSIRTYKHGHAKERSKEYTSWNLMIQRCTNKNVDSYKYYGGKGVKVCERWSSSFKNFIVDMGRKPTDEHSLDRYPDIHGDYEPTNCRWATKTEQSRNTKQNVWYEYNGEKKLQVEWANYFKTGSSMIIYHLKKGRSFNWIHNHFTNRKEAICRSKN